MLMALKASTKPKVKINWIKAISGNNIRCQLIPSPPNTQNIITMYPTIIGSEEQEKKEIIEEKLKHKVRKRLSQIEKFNAKYNRS